MYKYVREYLVTEWRINRQDGRYIFVRVNTFQDEGETDLFVKELISDANRGAFHEELCKKAKDYADEQSRRQEALYARDFTNETFAEKEGAKNETNA